MPINKIVFGGTTLLDLSNTTFDSADDLLTGVTGIDRSGTLREGTATAGSAVGVIYQDENGYVVLDDGEPFSRSISITENGTYNVAGYGSAVVNVAGGSGSGGVSVSVENLPGGGQHYIISGAPAGLEYEEGTYTPATDVTEPTIYFADQHSTTPIFVFMVDASETTVDTSSTIVRFTFIDTYKAFGNGFPWALSNSTWKYGYAEIGFVSNNGLTSNGNTFSYTSDSQNTYTSSPLYYVSSSWFKPTNASTWYYWRAGRTYKWIAVWK